MFGCLLIVLCEEIETSQEGFYGWLTYHPSLVDDDACVVSLCGLLQVGKDEVVGLLQGGSRHVLLITGGLL